MTDDAGDAAEMSFERRISMARSTTGKVAEAVSEKMNEAFDAATSGPGTDELKAQIATLRGDIEAIARTLASMGRAREEAMVEKMKASAADLKNRGSEKLSEVKDRADDILAEIDDHARRRPMTALALAAGFGVLVGLLLRRD
jgi:ElaB/YqjD/DUF883 family membrane-anchored ribosome-binding protein